MDNGWTRRFAELTQSLEDATAQRDTALGQLANIHQWATELRTQLDFAKEAIPGIYEQVCKIEAEAAGR